MTGMNEGSRGRQVRLQRLHSKVTSGMAAEITRVRREVSALYIRVYYISNILHNNVLH